MAKSKAGKKAGPGPSVKDDKRYEALRDEGMSKEKAARIANSPPSETGRKGGKSPRYEDWTVKALQQKAAEVGVKGRSTMRKQALIKALREH
ncbi:Rho termination factor N-terminal domain-containing protein [Marinobacter sp. BGYM27]|uniref:DUF7218 family protein n=1 Tax=Marinobacter sp. BGYM27 TaxID=2975597 RepID=UPI0021A2606A|nr:Rho termination factor N-terminal domain-containing protein [Marinobacter sp. BGYM27]MDG5501524.1 Rho termination factor N-terminal domain-containing protein [Marinobacter sp. BGYM27]